MLAFIRKSAPPFVLETLASAVAVAAALYAACPCAYAAEKSGRPGGGPGNGGDAVLLDGKWTLLDLAEAGITVSPAFERMRARFKKYNAKPNRSLARGFVNEVFTDRRFTPEFKEALASTLNTNQDGPALIAVLRMYQWQLTEAPLRNVGDERSTLDLSKMRIAQLAVRLDDRIQIHAPIFTTMDLLNQVATIHHELVYALTKPIAAADGTFFQPSWQARSQVACTFGERDCGAMESRMYAKGKPIFESTPLHYIGHFTTVSAQDGVQYPMYQEHPQLVLCGAYADELSLRMPVNGALSGSPILDKGLPTDSCVPMGTLLGMTSKTNQIPFGGTGPDSFCTTNRNGIVAKKTAGQMKAYDVTSSYFWEFEPLETATGSTRRPVVLGKSPVGNAPNSRFIGESSFATYEECLSQAQNALAKLVERTKRADDELLRSYGE